MRPARRVEQGRWSPCDRAFRSTAMVAIATLVSLGSSAPAALAADGEAAPSDYEAVDRFLEAQMRSHGIPGLSLALIEEGRVTHTRGYGQPRRAGT